MTKVNAFQTEDGKVFQNELDAIKHEQLVDLRNFITSHFNSNPATPQLPSAFAAMLTTKGNEIHEILKKYNCKIQGYVKRNQPKAVTGMVAVKI